MENVVDIESLPEIFTVSETDKLYVLCNRNGTWEKAQISISDLSAFFYEKSLTTQIIAKYNELMKLSADFTSFLRDSYPTSEYVDINYTQLSHFNDVYDSVETLDSVEKNYFEDYATISYSQYKLAQAKSTYEKIKLRYQSPLADAIATSLTVEEEDGDVSTNPEEN